MTDLLPCWFCGGKAYLTASSDGYGVECRNELCVKTIMQEHSTESEAIAAWNTRAERTCHDTGVRYPGWTCSECGHVDSCALNYCPNCGAKVME